MVVLFETLNLRNGNIIGVVLMMCESSSEMRFPGVSNFRESPYFPSIVVIVLGGDTFMEWK